MGGDKSDGSERDGGSRGGGAKGKGIGKGKGGEENRKRKTPDKLQCPICEKTFQHNYLEEHIKRKHTQKRFRCNYCRKMSFNLEEVKTHCLWKHGIKEIHGDDCVKIYINREERRDRKNLKCMDMDTEPHDSHETGKESEKTR